MDPELVAYLDRRFDAVDRRFAEMDRRLDELRAEMRVGDAATRRHRRRYHTQDGLALGAEGPHRLCPSDAQSVQLAWDVSRGIGAHKVAQTAVVQVRDEGSDGAQPVTPSAPEFGAPHGGIEPLDEVLIHASAR